MQKIRQYPIIILLLVNMIVGFFTFRDYGLTWDEPLFYDYANSLPYAYSPSAWLSGNFDLNNAFGSSATDHANRGPAYILIARPFESLLESFQLDQASAWHLINFLTFQFGIYLFYQLTAKWMNQYASLAATALFSWQPLLWGHAFINPKDPPFLVFFLGAIYFGFEMIDDWARDVKPKYTKIILAACFLGIATSIRVLGPLAGLLIGVYGFVQIKKISMPAFLKYFSIYTAITILVTFITWPYLWINPLEKFAEVFGFMSANPTQLNVLFNGQIYKAYDLPRRYLPILLGYTLTEPVWILFPIGLWLGFLKANKQQRLMLTLVLAWLIIPFAYVIVKKPPMYDGYRHFLFMLPPVFIFTGFAFEKLFEILKTRWVSMTLVAALLAPCIYGLRQLHPYQYAYYNSFTGGVGGAFRTYETDYWLTCYKEAIENFDAPKNAQLFVKREPTLASYYADENITIRDYRTEFGQIKSGDYVLVNTRSNEDVKTFKDAPVIFEISRGDALFCEIKKIP